MTFFCSFIKTQIQDVLKFRLYRSTCQPYFLHMRSFSNSDCYLKFFYEFLCNPVVLLLRMWLWSMFYVITRTLQNIKPSEKWHKFKHSFPLPFTTNFYYNINRVSFEIMLKGTYLDNFEPDVDDSNLRNHLFAQSFVRTFFAGSLTNTIKMTCSYWSKTRHTSVGNCNQQHEIKWNSIYQNNPQMVSHNSQTPIYTNIVLKWN